MACDPAVGLSTGRDPPCPRPLTFAEVSRWQSWPSAIRAVVPLELSAEFVEWAGDPVALGHSPAHAGYQAFLVGVCGVGGLRSQRCIGYGLTDARLWTSIGRSASWAAEQAGATVGAALRSVAPAFSFIPGIGQGIAVALSAAGALAAGENIGAALLEAASNAIPGGGYARMAFQAAAEMGGALLEGQNIGDAALAAARSAAESTAGPMAAAAFDAGLAIARGKALQDAGFAALKSFARGNDLAERAAAFGESVTRAAVEGRPVESVLTDALASELGRVAGDSARGQLGPVVDRLLADPSLREVGSDRLALLVGVAEPIARAAQVVTRGGVVDVPLRDALLRSASQRAIERYGLARPKAASAAGARDALAEDRARSLLTRSVSAASFVDVMRAPSLATSVPAPSAMAVALEGRAPAAPAALERSAAPPAAVASPGRSVAVDLAIGAGVGAVLLGVGLVVLRSRA